MSEDLEPVPAGEGRVVVKQESFDTRGVSSTLIDPVASDPTITIPVVFDPDGDDDPQRWPRSYRWFLTMLTSVLAFAPTFASSAPAGYAVELLLEFKLTPEVLALTITLFVIGFCVGPLLWGPLSEQYGRRPILIACNFAVTGFQIGCALSRNGASIMAFRLLGGIFSSASLVLAPAIVADIWDPATREVTIAVQSIMPFIGPVIGPIVGGCMAESGVPLPWVFWLLAILYCTCTVVTFLGLPETYRPVVLVNKAKRIRTQTHDHRWAAPLELVQKPTLAARLEETLARPFEIFVREPMLVVITIYLSCVSGCLSMLFEAIPIVFREGHHFSPSSTGLVYLPVAVGNVLALTIYVLFVHPRYARKIEEYAPEPVPPEARLSLAAWSAPLFAIAFFWFGWTSFPAIDFWAPMLSGFLVGLSSLWLTLALFNYIIDVYDYAIASALAPVTVMRSIFGAAFPLFSTRMFAALAPRWASTLVGCISCLLIPVPLVLMRYGPAIRAKSRSGEFGPPAA